MADLDRSAPRATGSYSCIDVLSGAEYLAGFADLRVERPHDSARAFVLPGYRDSHRHLPHGWKAEAGRALQAARDSAVSAAEAEGLAAVVDMGLGVIQRWPSRPTWITTAVAGLRDAENRDPVGFGIPVVDDMVDRVHRVASLGAGVIKIFATGSGRRPRRGARQRRMAQSQIAGAVATADQYGLPVVAHCHGGPALWDCLSAGVTSIEHGLYLTRQELQACREANVSITLTPGVYISVHGDSIVDQLRQTIADTLSEEVTLKVGTDTPRESLARQIWWLIRLGVPPKVAITAGTADPKVTNLRLLFERNPADHPDELLRPMAIGRTA